MLRLHDPRTGQVDELPAGRTLRVHVGGPRPRLHVLADVLRRAAERRRRRMLITVSDTSRGRDLTALNIPPADQNDPTGADLHITDLRIGPAEATGAVIDPGRALAVGPSTGEAEPDRIAARGLDPLAVRLAALRRPYREPLALDRPTIEDADHELRHWRARVAEWAESPSKPMSAEYLAEALDALDNDLDTPGALQVLRRLDEDAAIPPGSKFETFSFLDMVFALDLVRDIGR